MESIEEIPPAEPSVGATRLKQLLLLIERHKTLFAFLSFCGGAASLALLKRDEHLAQTISVTLVLSWVLMLFERIVGQIFDGQRWVRLSPYVLRYGTQIVHQQTFFYSLPFFLESTTWLSGQAVFTVAAALAAACSMWDPLYFGVIAARPFLHFAYHAFAMYLALLTVPPALWQITTSQSLQIATVGLALLVLPSFAHVHRLKARRWPLMLVGALLFAGIGWFARPWVPPATLWLSRGVVTSHVDAASREPVDSLGALDAAQLARGVTVFTEVHAPRGLREPMYHCWYHNGQLVQRIALEVAGGREQGYRAWSLKRHFPADSDGRWVVKAMTDSGQMIGEVRFTVVSGAAAAAAQQDPAPAPVQSVAPPPVSQLNGSEPAASAMSVEHSAPAAASSVSPASAAVPAPGPTTAPTAAPAPAPSPATSQ